jgi:TRAP-type C4-dicarboxylate transport system permease small subunit
MNIENVNKRLEFISSKLAYLGTIALLAMMLLTTADVVGRYFFNSPILGALEVTEFLVLILIFSFLAHTQAKKSHVAVDLFFDLLPRSLRSVIDFINHLVCLAFMGLIAYMGIHRALEIKEFGEATNNLGIVKFPFAFFVVFGCAVMCIEYLRDIIGLLTRKEKGGNA